MKISYFRAAVRSKSELEEVMSKTVKTINRKTLELMAQTACESDRDIANRMVSMSDKELEAVVDDKLAVIDPVSCAKATGLARLPK